MICGHICVAALSFPEQLLVWAIRQWTGGRDNWPCVEQEFRRVCQGAAGLIAATALAQTVALIAASARRPVHCHPLNCDAVSPDEAALLALVAASQVCDRSSATAYAADFMPDCMVPLLLENVAVLGAALAAADRALPPRYAMPEAGTTIH